MNEEYEREMDRLIAQSRKAEGRLLGFISAKTRATIPPERFHPVWRRAFLRGFADGEKLLRPETKGRRR